MSKAIKCKHGIIPIGKCRECFLERRRIRTKNRYLRKREHILQLGKLSRERNKEKIRERKKVYYRKNRKRILEEHRIYGIKNKTRILNQKYKYYQENHKKILVKKREYWNKNKEKLNEGRKKEYDEARDKLAELFGSECIICNSPKIYYHEIHGVPHKTDPRWILFHLKNKELEFIPLCYRHHRFVHNLAINMKFGEKAVDKLFEIAKVIYENRTDNQQ